jgi:hypothetical protein
MKTFNIIFILALVSLSFVFTGCTKDDSTPDSDRSAYIGKWNVTPTKLTYEVTISEDPNTSNGVFISNFALIGSTYPPASAEVNGSSIVLDANQVIGDGLVVNGSGVFSGNKITWNYTIFDGADLTNVSETYTRK